MKGVLLDAASLGDLDLTPLNGILDTWRNYPTTSANEVVRHISDAEIVLTNKVEINRETISACPNIKLISIVATGANNIDLSAAKERDIIVCNASGYGTASVVQHTMALMLALSTNLIAYHQDVQQGRWQQSRVFTLLNRPITELAGKTLGILGYGALGSSVATIAKAFGMEILISARHKQDYRPNRVPLRHLLNQSDYVSLHCPLTAETRHVINRDTLQLMKPTAFLINTARGALIKAVDLVWALRHSVIKGAGIDVLAVEPALANDPLIGAGDLNNLIITPHNAWGAIESRQRLLAQTIENINGFLDGNIQRSIT